MLKIRKNIQIIVVTFLFLAVSNSCQSYVSENVSGHPDIYPDYTNIVIPFNIAPLNFMSNDTINRIRVRVVGQHSELTTSGSKKIQFSMRRFKRLLHGHIGDTLKVEVQKLKDGVWYSYERFWWFVAQQPVDNYLTYRLIEPAYEVWNKLNISQREVSSFSERILADNNLTDGACMNCHISNVHNAGQSFFHMRHAKGGTVINQHGELRKIDTRTDSTMSPGIYGNWHPSGRYIAFSTNVIIPEFHSHPDKRMLVYDTASDLIVLDLETNEVFSSPMISRPDRMETFPEFSTDGKTLYFCVADTVLLPTDYKKLKYSLCSISFDPETRTFGNVIDTLFCSEYYDKTVSQPRVSPNGQYLMFTVFDYGTFPIWHPDARLYLMDLETGDIGKMPEVNKDINYSNSHHSWSSNSRWFVFASKRDNGMFGKPYFSWLDENGNASKPFVLPQRDPEFYDYFYKSFNIPELFEENNKFDLGDIERLFNMEAEIVDFVKND